MNVKGKSEGISHHSLNVCVLALMLGKKIGLTEGEMHCLGLGALFHDIGKTRIDKKILRKSSPYTKSEKELFQRHPQYGIEIVSKSGAFPDGAGRVIAQHHEWFDGQGYPEYLKMDQIDRLARITSIVDAYDILCNDYDPEKCLTPYEALSFMYSKLKNRFDPQFLAAFIRCSGVYPPGTVVKLSNGVTGIVVSVNSQSPLKPSLLLYDKNVPKDKAIIFDMDDDPDVSVESSIRPGALPNQVRQYLCPASINYFVESAGKSEGCREA